MCSDDWTARISEQQWKELEKAIDRQVETAKEREEWIALGKKIDEQCRTMPSVSAYEPLDKHCEFTGKTYEPEEDSSKRGWSYHFDSFSDGSVFFGVVTEGDHLALKVRNDNRKTLVRLSRDDIREITSMLQQVLDS